MFFIYHILPQYCCFMQLIYIYRSFFLVVIQASVIFLFIDAYQFSSREAEYCTPSLNLTLGLPLHLSCGRFCVLQTFLHSQCRFQKQRSKMRTAPVPPPLPSTPLQMTHSNTWPELLVLSFFKLTNFCFWQGMARIKIGRSAAGKNKQTKIIHHCV